VIAAATFDGTATWPFEHDGSATRVELRTTHTYDEPGAYFPALQASLHRDGDTDDVMYRCLNLGRVHVVVT